MIPPSGNDRNRQGNARKVTVSCRKTREIAGTWKQYSRREFSGFFPMISGRFLPESTGSCRNPREKTRKIPARNTASNFLVFSGASRPFPAVRRSPGVLFGRNRPEIIGKNPENSRRKYCFHVPAISRVFLQDTVTFRAFPCRFLQYPFSGIIGLGYKEMLNTGNDYSKYP